MTIHVVGAGIAGLAAALRFAESGRALRLHEATAAAGGRCRSFHDARLGLTIDSGIHLILGYQADLRGFLGAAGMPPLERIPLESCHFLDRADGEEWHIKPGSGRMPWWLLDPARRSPDTGLGDLRAACRLLLGRSSAVLAELVPVQAPAWRRFWEPLCIAALNTRPEQAAAALLRPFLQALAFGGPAGHDPMVVRGGLSAGLIAPALARLASLGVRPEWRNPLRAIEVADGKVVALRFRLSRVVLAAGDAVLLALPPSATARLLPGVARLPDSPIVTAHFRLPVARQRRFTTLLSERPMWLLADDHVATVTVGAAAHLLDLAPPVLAARLWAEVRGALDLPPPMPPARVLKFRHGTYLHSLAAERAKPELDAGLANLRLAGDWTLPGRAANLDSAARSGHLAAEALLAYR